MDNELYWVQVDKNSYISNYTQDNKLNQAGWYRVAVNQNQIPYFKAHYSSIKYDQSGHALVYPPNYERSSVAIADRAINTSSDALYNGLTNEIKDVLDSYDPETSLSSAPFYHQPEPIYNLDFTEPLHEYQVFDSFNYQLTPRGLVLTSRIDPDTGICKPARFRAFGIPLRVNEYAITTFKVPETANSKGVDFSFWYFNTNHKYGYSASLGGSDFDNNEFDVDEIHNGIHYLSLYDHKRGNTFKQIPEHDDIFYKQYHTLAIKWTNAYMSYYLDGHAMFTKDVSNISDTMFPTWEIEAPSDGKSSTWGGGVMSSLFPSHAIVTNYQVYKI